jgi:hypothetical protein
MTKWMGAFFIIRTVIYSVISTAADGAQRSLRNGEISSGLKPGVTEFASTLFLNFTQRR